MTEQIRLDVSLVEDAKKVFRECGMSLNDAIALFLTQAVSKGTLPFEGGAFVDELGENIEVVNGVEFVIATQEDLQIMKKSENRNDFMGLEDFKKELCID